MSGYKEYREKVLSDADIKAEYDALGPEYDLLQAVINAKSNQTVIQKESSGSTGIAKEEI